MKIHLHPAGGDPRRRGASAAGVVAWLVGFGVLCAPFLRPAASPTWIGEDTRRAEIDVPFDEDVTLVEEELSLTLAEPIRKASERWFGLESEAFLESGLVEVARLAPGQREYATQCAGCHGESGDGAGQAARFLSPRPRNFRKGTFKFTSTPSGEKPLRRDLLRTITRGLSGSAMPDFRLVPEERRHDLVEYVRYLAMRGEFEQLMLDVAYEDEEVPDDAELAEIVYSRWFEDDLRATYPTTPENARDDASIERGREVFLDANLTQCALCHGELGKGDGVNADAYEDEWGYTIVPRDFTRGVFRAGDSPEDLWRSIATGINGTPMGGFEANLSGDQIWDVVHFVQALARGDR